MCVNKAVERKEIHVEVIDNHPPKVSNILLHVLPASIPT